MTGLVGPGLDAWFFACSIMFLIGLLLVVLSPVVWLRERMPRALPTGFLLAVAAVLAAGLAAWWFG